MSLHKRHNPLTCWICSQKRKTEKKLNNALIKLKAELFLERDSTSTDPFRRREIIFLLNDRNQLIEELASRPGFNDLL